MFLELNWEAESTRTLFKGNGKQVVGIGIYQQSDANTIAVADGIKNKIKELQPSCLREQL